VTRAHDASPYPFGRLVVGLLKDGDNIPPNKILAVTLFSSSQSDTSDSSVSTTNSYQEVFVLEVAKPHRSIDR
jgi:hypothetical protein